MGKLLILFAIALAGLVAPGAHAQDAAPPREKPQFELLHLWLTPQEADALAALSDPVKAAGVQWSEHRYTASFLGLKTEYAERLALHEPPTGAHWIGGAELKRAVEAGVFRLIADRPGRPQFRSIYLPEVYDIVSYEGGVTALPVGIHLQNHFAYNAEMFAAAHVAPPETWDELIEAAKKLKAAGHVPLVMSDQRWQLRFLFSSILTAVMSADDFTALLQERIGTPAERTALVKAFRILDALRPYVNADNRDLAWSDATGHLMRGEAAMQILADFASTLYANDPKIKCQLPPQNNYVVWAFDAIALTRTRKPAEIAGQNIFIDAASSVENLHRYVARKGGVPVYRWTTFDGINACSQQSMRAWSNARRKVHIGTEWTLSLNIIASFVQKFWRDPAMTPDTAAAKLVDVLQNVDPAPPG
ncbi:MAG: carbohydrate ABC transporter substrate-binding protein [Hyphomicrobiales bacterium]|nr:carbohydrate ABC transporter substrate-binding protein [Hyphomicrobiales bacterium]